jgi:hypothetical protein
MERYHLCISTNIILITLLKTVFTIFWTDTNQTLKSQLIQIISCRFSMPFWCVYIFNRDCNLQRLWNFLRLCYLNGDKCNNTEDKDSSN